MLHRICRRSWYVRIHFLEFWQPIAETQCIWQCGWQELVRTGIGLDMEISPVCVVSHDLRDGWSRTGWRGSVIQSGSGLLLSCWKSKSCGAIWWKCFRFSGCWNFVPLSMTQDMQMMYDRVVIILKKTLTLLRQEKCEMVLQAQKSVCHSLILCGPGKDTYTKQPVLQHWRPFEKLTTKKQNTVTNLLVCEIGSRHDVFCILAEHFKFLLGKRFNQQRFGLASRSVQRTNPKIIYPVSMPSNQACHSPLVLLVTALPGWSNVCWCGLKRSPVTALPSCRNHGCHLRNDSLWKHRRSRLMQAKKKTWKNIRMCHWQSGTVKNLSQRCHTHQS